MHHNVSIKSLQVKNICCREWFFIIINHIIGIKAIVNNQLLAFTLVLTLYKYKVKMIIKESNIIITHIGLIMDDTLLIMISKKLLIGISIPPNTMVLPIRCCAQPMAVSIIFSPVRIHPINHLDDHIEAYPINHEIVCLNIVFILLFLSDFATSTINGNPNVSIGVVRKSI